MRQPATKVVVLGLDINGLALVRSIAAEGIEVSGVYTNPIIEVGRFSRYCKAIRFPYFDGEEHAFVGKLVRTFGDRIQKPVLFATTEEYLQLLSRNRHLLQTYFRFVLPDKELLVTLTRKDLAAPYLAKMDLRVPKTCCPRKDADVQHMLAEIEYPCLMKPIDTSWILGSKALTFGDADSLRAYFQERPAVIGRVILQQLIPGDDTCLYETATYVSKDGIVLPIFTMQKIRQFPPYFGTTSYGISEYLPDIASITDRLLRRVRYRGLVNMEFKKHSQTGEWFFIELNPRLPLYHSLIYTCEINYPYAYYSDLLDLPFTFSSVPQNGVPWIYLGADVASFLHKFRRKEITLGEWFNSVAKARSHALFDRTDMKPLLYAFVTRIIRFFRNLNRL